MDRTKEPLEQVKKLLRDFLNEKISAGEFETAFFSAVEILRDMTDEMVKTDAVFAPLFKAFTERLISSQEFEIHCKNFMTSLGKIDYVPFSRKDEALNHLWVEVDAYREDPLERKQGLHIGGDELRKVVLETLAILDE